MNLVDSCGWLEYFADGPMADSVILATANICNATIWTQDAHFEKLPRVKYVAKS